VGDVRKPGLQQCAWIDESHFWGWPQEHVRLRAVPCFDQPKAYESAPKTGIVRAYFQIACPKGQRIPRESRHPMEEMLKTAVPGHKMEPKRH
jgi:hypothetical protein